MSLCRMFSVKSWSDISLLISYSTNGSNGLSLSLVPCSPGGCVQLLTELREAATPPMTVAALPWVDASTSADSFACVRLRRIFQELGFAVAFRTSYSFSWRTLVVGFLVK